MALIEGDGGGLERGHGNETALSPLERVVDTDGGAVRRCEAVSRCLEGRKAVGGAGAYPKEMGKMMAAARREMGMSVVRSR